MLIQEVGFDIVSIWKMVPWLYIVAGVLLGVLIVYAINRAISASRRSSRH